jgi:glutaredoxin
MSKTDDLYNPRPSMIVMYSTSWCPDCRRSRAFFTGQNIEHVEIDIGKDREAFAFIEKLTRRVRIPTIVFPDGTIFVEPTDEELGKKLNASIRA